MGIRRVRRRRPQQFGGVSEKATWGPWRGAFTGTSTWNTHCSGSRFGGSERTASAANRTEIAANTTSVQASDTIDSRPVSDLASADFGTISPYPTVVAVTNEKYMNVGRAGLAGSPANESAPASRQTAAKSVEKTVTIAKQPTVNAIRVLPTRLRSWNAGCKATIHLLTLFPSMSPNQRPP